MKPHGPGRLTQLRYTGVAAVVVLWTSIGIGMARTGLAFSDDRPISYLGTDSRSALLFTMALLVAAVLLAAFYVFVHQWFSSSGSFLAVGFIGLAGQVVAAVVPISGSSTGHTIHTAGGIVVGLSLPLLMWRFAASQPREVWRTRSYAIFWLEVGACVVGVLLSRSMRAPIAEIVPGSGFHMWIFIVTIRSLKARSRVPV